MSSVEQFTLTRRSEGWKPVLTMCVGTFGSLLLTILLWHFTRHLVPDGVAAGIYMVLGLGSVVVPQLYLYTYPRRGAVTLSLTPQAFTFTRDGETVRGRREELVLTYGTHRRYNRFVPASDTPVLIIAVPSKRQTLSIGTESTVLRWQSEQRMRSPTHQLPPSEFRQLAVSLGLPLESTGQANMTRSFEARQDSTLQRLGQRVATIAVIAALVMTSVGMFATSSLAVLSPSPWPYVALGGLVGTALLIFGIVAMLGWKTDTRRYVSVSVCSSLVIGPMCATAVLHIANAMFDASEVRHTVQVLDKKVTLPARSKAGPRHELEVRAWSGHREPTLRVEPSREVFDRVRPSQQVVIVLGSGALGFEWVRRVEVP